MAHIKNDWAERQKRYGNTQRAVLCKRLPEYINSYIHKKQAQFTIKNLPESVTSVLDVGCGYGRISGEIRSRRPNISFEGIELTEEFAREYRKEYGPCFVGPVQSYRSDKSYDVVIMVTILMYLDKSEIPDTINMLIDLLKTGGRLICIEPAIEMNKMYHFISNKKSASPTGGDVLYFTQKELIELCSANTKSAIIDHEIIRVPPIFKFIPMHHCVAVAKV